MVNLIKDTSIFLWQYNQTNSCLLSDLAFEWQRGWRWPCWPLCFCRVNAPQFALEQLDLHNKSNEVFIKTRSPQPRCHSNATSWRSTWQSLKTPWYHPGERKQPPRKGSIAYYSFLLQAKPLNYISFQLKCKTILCCCKHRNWNIRTEMLGSRAKVTKNVFHLFYCQFRQ